MRSEKGLTLIEVLAAVTLLGVAVLIFTNLSGFLTKADRMDSLKAEALQVAESRMSAIRANPASFAAGATQVVGTHTTFTVDIQRTAIAATPTAVPGITIAPVLSTALPDKHVTMSAIVYQASWPDPQQLITVTVAWGN